jgi:hypothetical protein
MRLNIHTIVFSIIDKKTGGEVWRLELPELIVFGIVFVTLTLVVLAVR